MNTWLSRKRSLRGERGAVAVEMAIILPLLALILALSLFFARVFWYYSMAHKAAHDAVRFLSTATQVEMRTAGASGGETAVATVARYIASTETASLVPRMEWRTIDVQCDFATCGGTVPSTVRVLVKMQMKDSIFDKYTAILYGDDGLLLQADVTMRYAGT